MALVSVIVPNYNHELYLKPRLDSIFEQTFQDFEVILLDDNSSDKSNVVFEEYNNKYRNKIALFERNEVNSGSPFLQWEKGLSVARGKYVWIAESDDIADHTFLETTVSFLEEHDNIGLVSSTAKIMNGEGEVYESTGRWLAGKLDFDDDQVFVNNGKEFVNEHMLTSNVIYNASGVLFRRSLLKNKMPLDYCNFRQIGDVAFWINLAFQADVAIINNDLNYWRKHDSSVTATNYNRPSRVVSEHLESINSLCSFDESFRKKYHHSKGKKVWMLLKRWREMKAKKNQAIRKDDVLFLGRLLKHYLSA